MFVRSASFCALLMVLSASLGATAQPLSRPLNPIDSDSAIPLHLLTDREVDSTLPGFLARRIQKDLGKRLNVPFQELSIYDATPRVCPDACLDVAKAGEDCVPGEVRGWEVIANSSQQLWTYRSDLSGQRLHLMSANATEVNREEFSAAIAQKVLKTASQQVQEPINNLHVLSVQAASWDGCLGIAAPDQACTENLVPGFRVVVGSEFRAVGDPGGQRRSNTENVLKEWVYHVSEDGSQLVQNAAANNPKPWVGTYLNDFSTQTPELGSDVFYLMSDHLYGGMRSAVSLSTDGTVSYELFSDGLPELSIPKKAIYQISLEDVAEIRALLKQQRFSNFDQMSYHNEVPNSSSGATRVLTAAGASVGFRVGADNLPTLLQPVVVSVSEIATQAEQRFAATRTD